MAADICHFLMMAFNKQSHTAQLLTCAACTVHGEDLLLPAADVQVQRFA